MGILDCLFRQRVRSESMTVEPGRNRALARFAAVLGALAFVLFLIPITSPPASHAAFPGQNGKIAFVSDRDGNHEIYVMNADGSGATRLTNNAASESDSSPDWQPLPTISVEIDIQPGSFPNSINLRNKGVVPVAILGTSDFNVDDVDVSTVEFAGASPVRFSFEDVNLDGHVDLVFHFRTQDLQLTSSDTEATLTGETTGGVPITGTDSVRIVK